MINGKRVIAFTPYGRESTVSILRPYLQRDHDRGLIDGWLLFQNTDKDQHSDREYATKLVTESNWISLLQHPTGNILYPKQLNTGLFYVYTQDPDTIYLRFDDDIVYVHEDAIKHLVEAKMNRPEVLVSFPIIWNNAIISWHLQVRGIIPQEFGVVGSPYCMDPMGWANGPFAEKIHDLLLNKIAEGRVEDLYMHVGAQLDRGQQFSVSCFAMGGQDYLDVNGQLNCEEEHWHTINRPYETGKSNVIVPNSLVSHLTFFPQRDYVLNQTNILQRYQALAKSLEKSL